MKLVYRILLHLSWALSLLLAAWAVLFYFTLIDEINDEVDDALEARAEQPLIEAACRFDVHVVRHHLRQFLDALGQLLAV